MKHLVIISILFVSINTFSQVKIPKHFGVLHYENVDSALLILKKIAKQQYKPAPTFIEITTEYVAQDRTVRKVNPMTMDVRSEVSAKAIYFENITRVIVRDLTVWKIYFESDITGQKDLFILKDKQMAEQAYAALMCLIRNSGNTRFD